METNRELKFKAWDRFYKQEIELKDFFHLGDFFSEMNDRIDNDVVIMQYTGLKDKNGKEIYEGDILKIDNWSCLFRVIWQQVYARFTVEKIGTDAGRKMDFISEQHCEVIGNTWVTPVNELP
jgi:hypothetical protein